MEKVYNVRHSLGNETIQLTLSSLLKEIENKNTIDGLYLKPKLKIIIKGDNLMIIPTQIGAGCMVTCYDKYEIIPKVSKLDRIFNTKNYKNYINSININRVISELRLKAAADDDIEITYINS